MERLATVPALPFYHPQIFKVLQTWLGLMERLWQDRELIATLGLVPWWQQQMGTDDVLLETLLQLGLAKILPQAYRQCRDQHRFQFFLGGWFDAFRTLKFVHFLRDHAFASCSLAELVPLMAWATEHEAPLQADLSLHMLQRLNAQLMAQEQIYPAETGLTINRV